MKVIVDPMFAPTPIADKHMSGWVVRFVPIADIVRLDVVSVRPRSDLPISRQRTSFSGDRTFELKHPGEALSL